jgi:sugar O-acyltransferase (sialic acid O-acetyltransferase NeuD family)
MNQQNRIFLYGASGHAKVVCEILEAQQQPPVGLIDDNPNVLALLSYPVFHSLEEAQLTSNDQLIISIGNNRIRKAMVGKLENMQFLTAVHPSAVLSERSVIGKGTVVMPQAVVNSDSSIGEHVILNTACSVDHDCWIGDCVHISPRAALAGGVRVGTGAQVGIGASVIQNVTIGKWATVGAGAVIIRDVPDYAVVVGNPGRIIKFYQPDMAHR